MAELHDRLADLIARTVAADAEYSDLVFDEPADAPRLRPPARPEQIAALEARFGRKLPSSYRAFLELYNGWEGFHADGMILGTDDHSSDWLRKRVSDWSGDWQDQGPDPFKSRGLPIMMGPDITHFVAILPDRLNPEGEPVFVEYDWGVEFEEYPDLIAMIEDQLAVIEALITIERHGEVLSE